MTKHELDIVLANIEGWGRASRARHEEIMRTVQLLSDRARHADPAVAIELLETARDLLQGPTGPGLPR